MTRLRECSDIAAIANSRIHARMKDTAEQEFAAVLLQDAIAAIDRHQAESTQLARRDLVRTLFASSEGLIWAFREHVVEAADETSELDPLEALALREEIHFITEQGRVGTQRRYIPLTASIRLCVNIARRLDHGLSVSFDDTGWQHFRRFIEIRNRLTHPKSIGDLEISSAETNLCLSAFFWVTEVVTSGMEAANNARKQYVSDFERILSKLKAGDPETMANYRAALLDKEDRN